MSTAPAFVRATTRANAPPRRCASIIIVCTASKCGLPVILFLRDGLHLIWGAFVPAGPGSSVSSTRMGPSCIPSTAASCPTSFDRHSTTSPSPSMALASKLAAFNTLMMSVFEHFALSYCELNIAPPACTLLLPPSSSPTVQPHPSHPTPFTPFLRACHTWFSAIPRPRDA